MTDIKHWFIVYTIEEPYYVGLCKVGDFPILRDAWTYTMFNEAVADTRTLSIKVVGLFRDGFEAIETQRTIVKATEALINRTSPRVPFTRAGKQRGGPVVDKVTGERFDNARALAQALGVTAPAVAQHLNNPHRIPTLKGRTFKRVNG